MACSNPPRGNSDWSPGPSERHTVSSRLPTTRSRPMRRAPRSGSIVNRTVEAGIVTLTFTRQREV